MKVKQECQLCLGIPSHAYYLFINTQLFPSLFQQGAWPKATDHARQTAFSSFPCHLRKPNKSSLGQRSQSSQEQDPNCSAQPYSATWRGSQTSTFKTLLEVHTHAFCMNTSLHLSLSPFPAWSRRHDCPAGAISACWDLLLLRRPPCKACTWLP